ncbi:MAG: MarR family transcriptional regulator [Defluviitaleaceae bacterium]|nr:MarR family transcriptional regulator [Defluviitaleaceae bacterium]
MTQTVPYGIIPYKEVAITKTQGGFLTSQIRHLSGRIWERLLKDSGVDEFNGAQGRILYVLWEHQKLTISEVGRLTSLANTTLTSMLDRMEAAGLVVRTPDTQNRRQKFVSVTDKAREYRQKYNEVSDQMNSIFYKGFTAAEVADFESKLRRILENLQGEA